MFVLKSTYEKAKKQLDNASEFYRSLRTENRVLQVTTNQALAVVSKYENAIKEILANEPANPNGTSRSILNKLKAVVGDGGTGC